MNEREQDGGDKQQIGVRKVGRPRKRLVDSVKNSKI